MGKFVSLAQVLEKVVLGVWYWVFLGFDAMIVVELFNRRERRERRGREEKRENCLDLVADCEAEESSSTLFTIDHILPRSIGGSDELENLALACHRCNNNRYNFVTGTDPETEQEITLFNPRQQQWFDHFIWSADG